MLMSFLLRVIANNVRHDVANIDVQGRMSQEGRAQEPTARRRCVQAYADSSDASLEGRIVNGFCQSCTLNYFNDPSCEFNGKNNSLFITMKMAIFQRMVPIFRILNNRR